MEGNKKDTEHQNDSVSFCERDDEAANNSGCDPTLRTHIPGFSFRITNRVFANNGPTGRTPKAFHQLTV
jgi:hypothetical protein